MSTRSILLTAFIAGAVTCLASGCAKDSERLDKLERYYRRGEYEDAVLLARGMISGGEESGRVHYYLGLALLALGRDYESFSELELAGSFDPSLAEHAAGELLEVARSEFDTGHRDGAKRKLTAAVILDEAIELRNLGFLAGEGFYDGKDYVRAALCYEEGLLASPDTVIAGETMLRLGEIYTRLGERENAERAYRSVLDRYPYGNYHTDAEWRLGNLMIEEARAELEKGNFETVLEYSRGLLRLTDNTVLTQNARYVMGQAYEGLLQYERALEQYLEIVRSDTGSSGSVVEKAQEKIDSFRRAGLYK